MNGEATDLYSPGFTLVRTQFADQHPELVVVKFLKVYDHAVKWQKSTSRRGCYSICAFKKFR
ncbi:hypothetical protein BsIDN1_16490 [Bacillus safensis]|uniref:Uncharacterized protein n=1 Tax=Bacillus safensis TaxID=561879 RepID=A0A5S9M517_BACIA|nr:hypothetical protein BsIDN1_16490 [Bacillus safensis]